MDPTLPLLIVLGFLVLMFVGAGIALWQINRKRKAKQANSFSSGGDYSDFSNDLRNKFEDD